MNSSDQLPTGESLFVDPRLDCMAMTIPNSILERLEPQEATIFAMIVFGRTTKQIATALDVSVRTIHYRKNSLFRKLGVVDRKEAVELIRKATAPHFGISA